VSHGNGCCPAVVGLPLQFLAGPTCAPENVFSGATATIDRRQCASCARGAVIGDVLCCTVGVQDGQDYGGAETGFAAALAFDAFIGCADEPELSDCGGGHLGLLGWADI